MYSSLAQGDASHKLNDNPVLKFYYSPLVLSVFCIGNAVFFSSLYSLYFTPGFIGKQSHNIIIVFVSVIML